MAKKPSPAELKAEGEELSKQIADIRKKDCNFAMVMGKDKLVFLTDKKKNCDILWRTAKKDAGGTKGAKGIVSMRGKVMVLDADDPSSVPGPMLKMAKKHFAERGAPVRIILKDEEEAVDAEEADESEAAAKVKKPGTKADTQEAKSKKPASEPAAEKSDSTSDDDADDASKREEALRKSLIQDFKAMKPDLDLAAQSSDPEIKKKVGGMARIFVDQIKTDLKKAHSVMGLMQSTIQSAKDNGQLGATSDGAGGDNKASNARRKKLQALEKGVDKLLERLG